jgi:LysM domain
MTQPRPVRTRTRLTRRGRIVVAALITAGVVLVAALAWLAGTARAEAAGSGPPANAVYHSLRSVVVQPGESLWAIAVQADPAGDPRSVMQEIIDINALRGTSVQPGQRLWLPRG